MQEKSDRPFSRGFEPISRSTEIVNDGGRLDIKTEPGSHHLLAKRAINNLADDSGPESEASEALIEKIELAMDVLKKKGILKNPKK